MDRRSTNPLLPSALTSLANLRWGSATAFVNTAVTSGSATLLTLHLQGSQGLGPIAAAAVLLPFSVMVIVGSASTPAIRMRLRTPRAGAVGMLFIAVGTTGLTIDESIPLVVAAVAVSGFGLGISSVASTMTGLTVPDEVRSGASGIINTAAQLGTAIGTAVLVLIASSSGATANGAIPRVAWLVAATLALATAVMWWLNGRRRSLRQLSKA